MRSGATVNELLLSSLFGTALSLPQPEMGKHFQDAVDDIALSEKNELYDRVGFLCFLSAAT